MLQIYIIHLLLLLCIVQALPSEKLKGHVFSVTKKYPLPNQGHLRAHDPNIIRHEDNFYLFKGGIHAPIWKSAGLSGPWTKVGTVLDGPTVIQKQNRTRPWAPTTVEWKGRFYCFYTVSKNGVRNSAIGVASTDSLESGWTDHGGIIYTKQGPRSHIWPYTVSNAIDPAFIADQETGQPYLVYGSYWDGIFQVPLADDLLSVKNAEKPDAKNLVFLPHVKVKPDEGAFMSYREPYYYLWFSHGKCCHFNKFPTMGQEYSVRVGRSKDVRGPFVDKDGKSLDDGGGTTVYGSNHGLVYAPGGLGVLSGNDTDPDILYYHYLNTSIGFRHSDAFLGWNYLEYKDGWPVARATKNAAPTRQPGYSFTVFAVLCMCCLALMLLPTRLPLQKLISLLLFTVTAGILLHK
ncbi:putative arabinan endo-1,5-alpha-L-arabinosidase D [Aspergillus avenaceus]|uniref:Putative arabinan endo-1,5-alpha-L-arabinosidase D n=1 Tax=Aspergillus avenaceus TaxID=36643 RepID=A0A5N6U797_ASPAV|nr:putative arabinan endo-1,5-alpha-L-arabinosidase D [Aspergillus avenaceus]